MIWTQFRFHARQSNRFYTGSEWSRTTSNSTHVITQQPFQTQRSVIFPKQMSGNSRTSTLSPGFITDQPTFLLNRFDRRYLRSGTRTRVRSVVRVQNHVRRDSVNDSYFNTLKNNVICTKVRTHSSNLFS